MYEDGGNLIVLREIFCQSPSKTRIKPAKYFRRCINGVRLYGQVVIVTKIKPGENLTDQIFYQPKIPGLLLYQPNKTLYIKICRH